MDQNGSKTRHEQGAGSMAQETTGPRADSVRISGMDPVDWERRVALARLRREAALAERDLLRASAGGAPPPPRATVRPALPQRAARLPLPLPQATTADRPARPGARPAAAVAAALAAASAALRHNPAPVAIAGALAGSLTVLAAWYGTRPHPVETASLAPLHLTAETAPPPAKTAATPAPVIAQSPAPVPGLPVAARASLPAALALAGTAEGARSRRLALGPYLLAARTSPADLRIWPAQTVRAIDADLIRGLVATALEE